MEYNWELDGLKYFETTTYGFFEAKVRIRSSGPLKQKDKLEWLHRMRRKRLEVLKKNTGNLNR